MKSSELERFVRRNYVNFNFRIVNEPSGGLTIWLSKKDATDVLRVRKFVVDYEDLLLNCYDVWLANLEEATISLRAECMPLRDGGRLTQEDAIRGWL